jgi:1-acyl-sn-glycerol-3-phosphate acyltransferase
MFKIWIIKSENYVEDIMLRTIYAACYIFVILIGTYFKLLTLKFLPSNISEQERDKKVYKVPYSFGRGMIRATGSTVHVTGLNNIPKDRAVLFVGNHQSNFDIPLLMGYLNKPHGYIAKVELQKVPIVAKWMKEMKCVFIDRKDRRKSLEAIKKGIEILKNGHSLVVFPEGTRSKSDTMGTFKAGSLTLATKSLAPIVPISISGSHRIMESNNNKVQATDIYLNISEPIYIEDVAELSGSELTKLVEAKVNKNLV